MADSIHEFKRQSGHVTVEYVVVTMVLILALFMPVTDERQSAVSLLMDAIRGYDQNRSLLYSLP
ncbi:MAG: hypothetical protein P8179_13825 [Candidatus Thiodiazotropha sp.]|jgi:hypothetical protein